jgi:hypothetical protein
VDEVAVGPEPGIHLDPFSVSGRLSIESRPPARGRKSFWSSRKAPPPLTRPIGPRMARSSFMKIVGQETGVDLWIITTGAESGVIPLPHDQGQRVPGPVLSRRTVPGLRFRRIGSVPSLCSAVSSHRRKVAGLNRRRCAAPWRGDGKELTQIVRRVIIRRYVDVPAARARKKGAQRARSREPIPAAVSATAKRARLATAHRGRSSTSAAKVRPMNNKPRAAGAKARTRRSQLRWQPGLDTRGDPRVGLGSLSELNRRLNGRVQR